MAFPDTCVNSRFLVNNPLVPAATLFLLGIILGRLHFFSLPVYLPLIFATAGWLAWLIAEFFNRRLLIHVALGAVLLFAGMGLWTLNQYSVAINHIARLVASNNQSLVALRASVLAAPADSQTRGNRYFIVRTASVLTERGWLPATGDLLVKWSGAESQPLPRNTHLELYGWLSRPESARNPGELDPRHLLATDGIFAQVHIPHAGGLVILDASEALPDSWLTQFRRFIRGKLLEHTLQENVPSAFTLTALLLGQRDPAITDVSQAFADAGVAHLLAISGSHIVFFTAMVWAILRFVPMRPRWRELLIAAIVFLYVLATPCGPPIIRAAVVLLMVLLSRLLARPRHYLNMLAAAAIVVVLIRPSDLFDAGFELTFITTAGLILFTPRLHAAFAGKWLARETLVADLSQSRWIRLRLRCYKIITAILLANGIGALTAAPLVAFHFGQINTWAVLSGMLALPAVSAAMVVAAVQLLAEIIWSPLGALLSPISAFCGNFLILCVKALAALPGAAIALRAPPVWAILAFYAVLILWIFRTRLALSRATIINVFLAALVSATVWYTLTAPTGKLRLTVLSADNASSILLRTPRGDLWTINAGSPQGGSLLNSALHPALRIEGSRRLDAALLTSLDAPHAGQAAAVIDTFHPRQLWLSGPAWQTRQQSLAGNQLVSAANNDHLPVQTLRLGQALDLGDGCHLQSLWPPANSASPTLIFLLTFSQHAILIADPSAIGPLTQIFLDRPTLQADAIILTGPERGSADEPLLRLLQPLAAQAIIWTGRGPWAPHQPPDSPWNTADGAISLEVTPSAFQISRP